MKYTKTKILAWAMGLLPLSAAGLTACSDTEPEEEEPQPELNPDLPSGVSQELYDKVHAIYDNTPTGPQTVTTVNRLATLTSICAANHETGPISVTPAQLNGEDITLVTLGGTDDVEGQATTMEENQLAGFGRPNDYLKAVTQLFADGTIPSKLPVIVSGISLGGMIAQQLLGVDQVMNGFSLKAIITFGSPITLPLDRKGVKVVRFADVHDKVPKLGEIVLRTGIITDLKGKDLTQKLDEMDEAEEVSRTSKYTDMIETHALSYIEDACWADVDFLGDPEKKNVLELKEKMTFYRAPKQGGK